MADTTVIEVRDMAIVHQAFRRAFTESARLVRAESSPAPDRVSFLAAHIDLVVNLLHNHHHSEDLILWPLLKARAPEDAAMVERVAGEHDDISRAMDAVTAAVVAWRSKPRADERDALATALDALDEVLQTHLDDEEGNAVPLAARTLTQEEWNSVGAHSRESIPKDKRFIAFGMLLEPLDDADRAFMMAEVPGPVKLLWRFVGQGQWTRYAAKLRQLPA
jgi:hemerythrin-like domain-containing protein